MAALPWASTSDAVGELTSALAVCADDRRRVCELVRRNADERRAIYASPEGDAEALDHCNGEAFALTERIRAHQAAITSVQSWLQAALGEIEGPCALLIGGTR